MWLWKKKKFIPFLDTPSPIENGKRWRFIEKSIPFSLSLRVVWICSKAENREKRLRQLKYLLLARNYPESLIDRSMEKAKKFPRKIALLNVRKKTTENRPIFISKYDLIMPSIQRILEKHWRAMNAQDKYQRNGFTKPPMTAYRRQSNLRNRLIKSKLPPPPRLYRERPSRRGQLWQDLPNLCICEIWQKS